MQDVNGRTLAVAVVLTDGDKRNIANMHPEATLYACIEGDVPRDQSEPWCDAVKAGGGDLIGVDIMEKQKAWLAMRNGNSEDLHDEILGVFTTEAGADAACTDPFCWYAPIPVNEVAPQNRVELPNYVYPRRR